MGYSLLTADYCTGTGTAIEILQVKSLNNILEQDHRFIKRNTKPIMGLKALHSASATIAGIDVAHMIRKHQFANDNHSLFKVFRSSQHNCVRK